MSHRPAVETIGIDPHLIVLFGGTGDLARRKLMPALYRMLERRNFADSTHVLAVATSDLTDDQYRRVVRESLHATGLSDAEVDRWCFECLSFQRITEGFDGLAARIEEIERDHHLPGNRAFYLAVPPAAVEPTVAGLAGAGLTRAPGWLRVVVEKPFGYDLASARELNLMLHEWFDESQIFRIDHYLAKETVQNLLAFRFANPLFESAWNRDRVESVSIEVSETLGLEGRARYFERAGIIRDMVQNHLLQILTLVAMEPPVRMEADAIRDEKVKVLRAIYPVTPSAVTRGRYAAGSVAGSPVVGYLDEDGVPETSTTETFASIRIDVDNWRWRGVPFTVRAGKRLAERTTRVVVRYKAPPVALFDGGRAGTPHANVLYITLQPDEGFELTFDVKTPGEGMNLETRELSFTYSDAFGRLPDAYETLMADVLAGDQTLFVRADEAEEAWRILEPVLDMNDQPIDYPAGSHGPESKAFDAR
jgi:glucose-6-phosphate 1-dehydrogenase